MRLRERRGTVATTARNCLLTAFPSGNVAATSGSSTTATVQACSRPAWGSCLALLQSHVYSDRRSSTESRTLLLALFILFALSPGSRPSADQPNSTLSVGERDQ
jgi:hypothetical protein